MVSIDTYAKGAVFIASGIVGYLNDPAMPDINSVEFVHDFLNGSGVKNYNLNLADFMRYLLIGGGVANYLSGKSRAKRGATGNFRDPLARIIHKSIVSGIPQDEKTHLDEGKINIIVNAPSNILLIPLGYNLGKLARHITT